MASPPPRAGSPPGQGSLALPRQRPVLALPGQGQPRSRKQSVTSTTSSAHPLRQTSFPPPDTIESPQTADDRSYAVYSPSQGSLDEFSDSEIVSAISAPGGETGTGRKRKRGGGEKRPRGRPPKNARARTGSASVVNGDDGRKSAGPGAPSVTGNGEGEEEDDDGDEEETGAHGGRLPLYEGGQRSQAELSAENQQRAMFNEHIGHVDSLPLSRRKGLTTGDHSSRYEAFGRAKLRTPDVRRLVNQTLSQSVPPNIITVVSAYTKLFAGMLIENAREVQAEWESCNPKRADGQGNGLYKRIKRSYEHEEEEGPGEKIEGNDQDSGAAPSETQPETKTEKEEPQSIKREPNSSSPQALADTQGDVENGSTEAERAWEEMLFPGGAGGLSTSLRECDRGPLQPDHLREALRRYKKSRQGGTVGFTGLSLEGKEVAAPRMSGRRLFR